MRSPENTPGRPLIPAALSFAAGCGLAAWLPPVGPAWPAAAAGAGILLWRAAAGRAPRSSRIAAAAVFLLIGVARFEADPQVRSVRGGERPVVREEVVAEGDIASPVVRRPPWTVFSLAGVRLRGPGGTRRLRRPVEIYLKDVDERFPPGTRLRVRGVLAPLRTDRTTAWFPRPADPLRRRLAARLYVNDPLWVLRIGAGSAARESRRPFILRLRERAVTFWEGRASPAAALCEALTTGERRRLGEEMKEDFYRAGLAHLLAVSGLHLGVLGLIIYVLLRRFISLFPPLAERWPAHYPAAAATIPFLYFFYRFTGAQVSAGRAALMGAVALAAVLARRRTDVPTLVAFAALTLLVADPLLILSVSFQLSVTAVAALALCLGGRGRGSPSRGAGRRLARYAAALAAVSFVAAAGTTPLVAFHFQRLSLAGPAANMIAVPLTCFAVLPGAWAALGGAALFPAAGNFVAAAAEIPARALIAFAGAVSSIPWSSPATPRPTPAVVVAALVFLAGAAIAWRGGRRRLAAAGLITLLAAAGWWWHAAASPGLGLVFFDVGQGDAALLRLPGGRSIVVDAGPAWEGDDAGRRIVAPALRRLGVRRIEALVLTHGHPDHTGGAAALLDAFPVGEVWTGPGELGGAPPGLAAALDRWERAGGRRRRLSRGDMWDGPGGTRILCLNPPRPLPGGKGTYGNENDDSLVLLVRGAQADVLLAADAGPRPLRDGIAGDVLSFRPLVLKVPHHGGGWTGMGELLSELSPAGSVISVGTNRYGHPDPFVVSALAESGPVFLTHRDGAVFFEETSEGFILRSWRDRARHRTAAERLRWLVE